MGLRIFFVTYLYRLDSPLWSVVAAIAIGAFIWILRYKAAIIVSVAATVHLVSTLVLHDTDRPMISRLDVHRVEPTIDGRSRKDLPPVPHLVMDEFAGLRGLPSEFSGGQELISRLVDYYTTLGFELYSHAYSQYFWTKNSLENLFNFSASNVDEIYLTHDNETFVLDKNGYFGYLLDLGYALHIYQSDYMNFCATPELRVASCLTYTGSIKTIESVDIAASQKSRFIFNSFLDSWAFLRNVRKAYHLVEYELDVSLPDWPAGNSSVGSLSAMSTIFELTTALRNLKSGEVHFAHLPLPHHPYNLNADCSLKPVCARG